MVTVSRILCPVDLSEFSRRALSHALALAGWYGAELTALHVRPRSIRPPGWGEDAALPVLEGLLEGPEHDAALRRLVTEVAAESRVVTVFRDGGVVAEIVRLARDLPADLVVMGTHGASGFERLMMGSVTEKVLRKAPCPVLTVPRGAERPLPATPVEFNTIVCGVDFSAVSLQAFDYALSLAQEAQARLVLVHVFEAMPPEHEAELASRFDLGEYVRVLEAVAVERLAQLVPDAARDWCEPELVVRHGKPYHELVQLAQERAADLLVLGAHGRGPLDVALFGSTTSQVVRQATCPVLTVTAGRRDVAAVA
jgi:nucleotide-binding universal stress UspA family protein